MNAAFRFAVAVCLIVIAGGTLTGVSGRGATGQRTQVWFDGFLYPDFQPAITDYVVRCPDNRVGLHADAASGHQLELDGRRTTQLDTELALRAGRKIVLVDRLEGGAKRYFFRCLPSDFPRWGFDSLRPAAADFYSTAFRRGPSDLRREYNRATTERTEWIVIFDRNGVPVWWFEPGVEALGGEVVDGSRVVWARRTKRGYGARRSIVHEIRHLNGTLGQTVSSPALLTDHHEFNLTPTGTYIDSYEPRHGLDLTSWGGPAEAWTMEGYVELLRGGEVIWSWSTEGQIDLAETAPEWVARMSANPLELNPGGTPVFDRAHLNSIEPYGDWVIVSLRHTNAVYAIDRHSGEIAWKLGGSHRPESLTVIGDPYGQRTFGGQHDARMLADGTLTVYDNRSLQGERPRAVRFAIDPLTRTATLLEQVADPLVGESSCCGSARRDPAGNWLVYWGDTPWVSEIALSGAINFRLRLPGRAYRVYPVADGLLGHQSLRRAMDSMAR